MVEGLFKTVSGLGVHEHICSWAHLFMSILGLCLRLEEVAGEAGGPTMARPVVRLPELGLVFTRIAPERIETSMIMHVRPGWTGLREYLRPQADMSSGCDAALSESSLISTSVCSLDSPCVFGMAYGYNWSTSSSCV